MVDDTLERFSTSLSTIGAGCSITAAAGFDAALAEAIEPPAVGTPLRIDGLSLAANDVEVAFEPSDLLEAASGVTRGDLGVASHGSVAIEATPSGDELASLLPPRQVTVLPASRLYATMAEAFEYLADAFDAGRDSLVFVTGNSATADMGATVEGVHGPGAVHVIVVEDR